MITRYIDRALERARYELLPDGTFAPTVRGLRGVVATGATLEACHRDLAEVIEESLLVRVARGSMCRHWMAPWSRSARPVDPPWGPTKRRVLISIPPDLGFEGPFSGGKHEFTLKGDLVLTIPNPHKGDIGSERVAARHRNVLT